jgi:hypothetical protein
MLVMQSNQKPLKDERYTADITRMSSQYFSDRSTEPVINWSTISTFKRIILVLKKLTFKFAMTYGRNCIHLVYHKKYVDKDVEIQGGEISAFFIVGFPHEYLCWRYNSRVQQQNSTYEELPCHMGLEYCTLNL